MTESKHDADQPAGRENLARRDHGERSGHDSYGEHAGSDERLGFSSLAIHAGQEPDPLTGAVVPPIYQVSTYKQDGVGGLRGGYEYSRSANPTRTALEECLAAIEGGARGLAFASGLAAEDCLLRTVVGRGRTRAVWIETPSNPLHGVSDIAALAGIAREAGALLVVDNTFATPYLQQPLALGADVVVHSTTKYIGGHSDVVGGALVVADAGLGERLAFHQNSLGAVAGPFDAWLTLRGIKTLAVRMDRHCQNAAAVAEMLAAHPKVSEVRYPGLPGHQGHEIAVKQMRAFGGMVSFRHADGEEAAVEMCGRTRLFTLGESLGGVESLIEHPGRMTHMSAAGSPLEVPADLVRLSVGIEDRADLLADLAQALG